MFLVQNFETIFIREITQGIILGESVKAFQMLSGSFFYSGDQKFYKPIKFKAKVWDLYWISQIRNINILEIHLCEVVVEVDALDVVVEEVPDGHGEVVVPVHHGELPE